MRRTLNIQALGIFSTVCCKTLAMPKELRYEWRMGMTHSLATILHTIMQN